MSIELFPAWDCKQEVRELFAEYTDMLAEGDSQFREYLAIQKYDEELEHLEAKYAPPHGRLYLVSCDGQTAGCIALRRIDAQSCEMKRLYVRPFFRGQRIGELLVRQVIDDARAIGYSHMLLDTLPFLQSALHLYRRFGFYEIPSYNDSPMETSIYMKLDL